MTKKQSQLALNWVAYKTLSRKEVIRFLRIWIQSLIPPMITTTLYFLIFGKLIGERVGEINGLRYIEFIAPGLILMSVLTNAYSNVSSSFFSAKFQNNIEEQLVSPMSDITIILGYITGGTLRGIIIGSIVAIVSFFFSQFTISHVGLTLFVVLLTGILFSLVGFLNGIFARSFDDVTIIPTFVLTPLTYLGGVFYSISMLPPAWQVLSYFNPIFYLIDSFRFAIFGVSETPFIIAVIILIIFVIALFFLNLYIMKHTDRLRK